MLFAPIPALLNPKPILERKVLDFKDGRDVGNGGSGLLASLWASNIESLTLFGCMVRNRVQAAQRIVSISLMMMRRDGQGAPCFFAGHRSIVVSSLPQQAV